MERASEQKTTVPTVPVAPMVPVATVKPHTVNSKPRKSREHRSRSQEWPDVPDVGKIEEQNPEILAQKILETGRQIEAGKITKPNVIVNGYSREADRHIDLHRYPKAITPIHRTQPQRSGQPPPLAHRQSPVKHQKPLNVVSKVQESPKVINFEDRLKSIITSVLNEDQEQRKATRQPTPTHTFGNGYVRQSPAHTSYGGRGTHSLHALHASPHPHAPPSPVAPSFRRDYRRDRYPLERRTDVPRMPPTHLDPRHHHVHQPDYTQVQLIFYIETMCYLSKPVDATLI